MARSLGSFCAVAVVALLVSSCGGSPPPKRGVIEQPIDGWGFRRYQQVLDIEVWVPESGAVAHTASYVRRSAEKRGRLGEADVVSAFVTRYESGNGVLPALVRFARRLAQESGYTVDEDKRSGQRVLTIAGHGESWVFWASGSHIVKIGGPGVKTVPPTLVSAYAERYPSSVSEGVLDAPLDEPDSEPTTEKYDPKSPTPDWKGKKRKKR